VQYDKLIDAARVAAERDVPRPRSERVLRGLVFGLFPRPRRLRWLRGPLRLYQASGLAARLDGLALLRRRFPSLMAMAELLPPVTPVMPLPRRVPARGVARGQVAMITGCVQSVFFPAVNQATARVLATEGYDVLVPPGQGCCGALSLHNGRRAEAQDYARRQLDLFGPGLAQLDAVIINAAGCGSSLKEYGQLLADDPRYAGPAAQFAAKVRDVSEFLAGIEPRAPRHPLPVSVAYHDACHLAHAQQIHSQPRQLLAGIPDLELREVPDGSLCCGSAGIYNIVQPGPARELGDRKARNVAATSAQLLVTANPGCLMHIGASLRRQGGTMPALHTVQVLDASLAGQPAAKLLAEASRG
jgi:glycolate oxidase iron-sulfur subunit